MSAPKMVLCPPTLKSCWNKYFGIFDYQSNRVIVGYAFKFFHSSHFAISLEPNDDLTRVKVFEDGFVWIWPSSWNTDGHTLISFENSPRILDWFQKSWRTQRNPGEKCKYCNLFPGFGTFMTDWTPDVFYSRFADIDGNHPYIHCCVVFPLFHQPLLEVLITQLSG